MVAPVLGVRDLAASVEWYRERLGLTPLFVSPDGAEEPLASISLGGPLLLWQLPADEAGPGSRAEHTQHADQRGHIVVVVDRPLGPIRERLVAAGVEATPIRTGSDNELFDVFDPDGHRFEVSRPAPEYR